MVHKLLVVMALLLLTNACANHALFMSDPPGARVVIKGEAADGTPCMFDYATSSGETGAVVIEKTGFVPLQRDMKADGVDSTARNRWLAAGVVWSPLWLGTFFTKKLKNSFRFVLKQDPAIVAMETGKAGRTARLFNG